MSDFLGLVASEIYTPIAFLLIFGGIFFLFYSGFAQYRYFFHTVNILRGKYHRKDAPGHVPPYQAFSTAMASTVGMGNIAGVAVAIALGGPGALLWMWVTAFFGMSTNFFTTTLSLMYRGRDSHGVIQGGPMYVIREAMGKRWYPLAIVFSICSMVGCFPVFQANQLAQAVVDTGLITEGIKGMHFSFFGLEISVVKFFIGIVLVLIVGIVTIGGIRRIGNWAGRIVPVMVVLYFGLVAWVLLLNMESIPKVFFMIFSDAFEAVHYHGDPVMGGAVGGLIVLGVRRASFSSEAGLGTIPLALSAARCDEPVREGLVSMFTPAIDTIIVCSLTGFAILITGVWRTTDASGISLMAASVEATTGSAGKYLLLLCVFFFAVTSLFSYSYYGSKSMSFVAGAGAQRYYVYLYLTAILVAAVADVRDVVNVVDIAYALMALPTVSSAIVLAPRVMKEAKMYFSKY